MRSNITRRSIQLSLSAGLRRGLVLFGLLGSGVSASAIDLGIYCVAKRNGTPSSTLLRELNEAAARIGMHGSGFQLSISESPCGEEWVTMKASANDAGLVAGQLLGETLLVNRTGGPLSTAMFRATGKLAAMPSDLGGLIQKQLETVTSDASAERRLLDAHTAVIDQSLQVGVHMLFNGQYLLAEDARENLALEIRTRLEKITSAVDAKGQPLFNDFQISDSLNRSLLSAGTLPEAPGKQLLQLIDRLQEFNSLESYFKLLLRATSGQAMRGQDYLSYVRMFNRLGRVRLSPDSREIYLALPGSNGPVDISNGILRIESWILRNGAPLLGADMKRGVSYDIVKVWFENRRREYLLNESLKECVALLESATRLGH